ncbi:MAG: hypothetical protein V1746_00710 [bacterium]
MERDGNNDSRQDTSLFQIAPAERFLPPATGKKIPKRNRNKREQETFADVLWSIQEGWERDFNALKPGAIIIQCASLVGEREKIERTCQGCMGKSIEDFILQDLLSTCKSKPSGPLRIVVEGDDFHTLSLRFYIKDMPQSWADFGDRQCDGSGVSYSFAFEKNRLYHCYVGYYDDPSPQLDTLYREVLPTIVEFCDQRKHGSLLASKKAFYHGGVIEKGVWSGDTPMGWYLRRHAREQWSDIKGQLPRDVVRRIKPVYRFRDPRDIRRILDEPYRMPDGVLLREHLMKPFLDSSGLVEMNLDDSETRRRMEAWLGKK